MQSHYIILIFSMNPFWEPTVYVDIYYANNDRIRESQVGIDAVYGCHVGWKFKKNLNSTFVSSLKCVNTTSTGI